MKTDVIIFETTNNKYLPNKRNQILLFPDAEIVEKNDFRESSVSSQIRTRGYWFEVSFTLDCRFNENPSFEYLTGKILEIKVPDQIKGNYIPVNYRAENSTIIETEQGYDCVLVFDVD